MSSSIINSSLIYRNKIWEKRVSHIGICLSPRDLIATEILQPQAVSGAVVALEAGVHVPRRRSRVSLEHILHGYLTAAGRPTLDPKGVACHAVDVVRAQGLHLRLPAHRHYTVAPTLERLECLASCRHVPRQA